LKVQFRSELFNSGWKNNSGELEQQENVRIIKSNKLFLRSELPSKKVVRILDNLLPGEISIVFESEPNIFTVVQLVEFLKKNSIPELSYIQKMLKRDTLLLKEN